MSSQYNSTYPAAWAEEPETLDWRAQENVAWSWEDFDGPMLDALFDPEPASFDTMAHEEGFDEANPEPDPFGTMLDGFAPAAMTTPAMTQDNGDSHALVFEDDQSVAQPDMAPVASRLPIVVVPGTVAQRGRWWQRESISPDDWEDIRPFFVQLYIEENVKLEDVMAILAKHLDFNASIKMYKTQIARWGLAKNYKASEKEHIARVLKQSYDTGRTSAPLTIRGRPVQLHRVRRHCKKQGSLPAVLNSLPDALWQSDRSQADVWISTHGGCHVPARRSERPQKHLSLTTKNDRIELVLRQTEIYIESASPTGGTNDVNRSKAQFFHEKVWDAGDLLHAGKFDGVWRRLSLACEMAHEVLVKAAMQFLRLVVGWYCHPGFDDFPEVRLHLLRFLARLSVAKLGTRHPISVVLFHMLDDEVSSDMVRPYLEVMKDTTSRVRADDIGEVAMIQSDQVEYLIYTRKDLQAAESVRLQCVESCGNSFGWDHYYTRDALRQLGEIYQIGGRYDEAIAVCEDVLGRGSGRGSEPDWVDVDTTINLARTHEDLRDTRQSVEYWHRSLEMALAMLGLDKVEMIVLIEDFKRSFRTQGLDPQAWLQGYFGIFNT